MTKYPIVLFFRAEEHSSIDTFLEANVEKLECTVHITNDIRELNKLFDFTYYVLVSYGTNPEKYYPLIEPHIVSRINNRWIHVESLNEKSLDEFNYNVNFCYIHHTLLPREQIRPTFSIFTTSYNSYHKIQRAYQSLQTQTCQDWEWVIMDDSPDDTHFTFLRNNVSSLQNHKIRVYRRDQNSGNIGNVKNEAISLCRGKYVLEFDHDDEILPHCLEQAKRAFESDAEVGFVYMDCCNIYENGANFRYGDFIAYGYGGYYCQKMRTTPTQQSQWVFVYVTPNINNITSYALIALPNHPRIWRRSVLMELGNYNELLPICDDLEILMKTFADKNIKVVKVHTLAYVQYMNAGNNNFSLIRNSEINRLGPQFISPFFYKKHNMHQIMRDREAYEDESYLKNHTQIWKRPPSPIYENKYLNQIVNYDMDAQMCVLGVNAFRTHINLIQTNLESTEKRWELVLLERDCAIETLWQLLDTYKMEKAKCYCLQQTTYQELTLYFNRLLKHCDNTLILETIIEPLPEPVHTEDAPEVNETFAIALPEPNTVYSRRFEIINAYSTPDLNYLEIGIEYGTTFSEVHFENKTGVDPSHKVSENQREYLQIQNMTSDDFFVYFDKFMRLLNDRKGGNKFIPRAFRLFDIAFIDGMHQAEYVMRDINHCVHYLNENGILFVDDILPLTEDEQLKIPKKHIIEDGILKYVSPWTGDVWKVVYHMILHYGDHFSFQWFHHPNYRGVFMMHSITKFSMNVDTELSQINQYEYRRDFQHYLDVLCSKNAKDKNMLI